MIRYSNRSFFGSLEMQPFYKEYNSPDFQVNLKEFEKTWEALMLSVIAKAISSSNPKYLWVVQCSRDISPWSCGKCLRDNVDHYKFCCHGKTYGLSFRPSCYMRWDVYSFYGVFDNKTSPTLPLEKSKISELSCPAIVFVIF